MTDDTVTVDAALAELPDVARAASDAVLDLYGAICQARALGASYTQLERATGLSRGNVQRVVSGEVPKFAAK